MRVVIQRVREAHVTVAGEVTGRIGHGLLVLAGFSADESEADLDWTVQKIVKAARLFRRRGRDEPRRAAGRRAHPRRLAIHPLRLDEEGQPSFVEPRRAGEVSQPCSNASCRSWPRRSASRCRPVSSVPTCRWR